MRNPFTVCSTARSREERPEAAQRWPLDHQGSLGSCGFNGTSVTWISEVTMEEKAQQPQVLPILCSVTLHSVSRGTPW